MKQLLTAQLVRKIVTPLLFIALALLVGAIAIILMGRNPVVAYGSLFSGALGSKNGICESLVAATPLIFTGLSFALAKKGGIINIGAEGQLYMGGLVSAIVGIYVQGLPVWIHLPLAILAGFVGGGMLGLFTGWLKVRFGASEIITTVMLNYVAIYLVSYLVNGPMIEPPGNNQWSSPILATAQLPVLLTGTRFHLGFLIGMLFIVLYYLYVWRTKMGYRVRAVGLNPSAAEYAGMEAKWITLTVMFLAGGLGGLAGSSEILGIQHRLYPAFSPGYGYDGIAVALLGNNGPAGVFLASLLFGILRSGGNTMQMMAKVSSATVYIIQAFVIIFVAADYLLRKQWENKKTLPAKVG